MDDQSTPQMKKTIEERFERLPQHHRIAIIGVPEQNIREARSYVRSELNDINRRLPFWGVVT